MNGHRLLPSADARLRVTPWRGDATTAQLVPTRGRPDAAAVARALDELAQLQCAEALTPALSAADQQPFLDAGFEVRERLHLLRRPLDHLPAHDRPPAELRRARAGDRPAVLAVDAAAFPLFWRLDGPALDDALAATPSVRFRVACPAGGGPPKGYAVTGRAGPRGYLQRLAVEPARQGQGIGAALVVDGLRWLRRWGAKEVLVNTQEANVSAVRLYEQLGFRLQAEGLAVLHRRIGTAGR